MSCLNDTNKKENTPNAGDAQRTSRKQKQEKLSNTLEKLDETSKELKRTTITLNYTQIELEYCLSSVGTTDRDLLVYSEVLLLFLYFEELFGEPSTTYWVELLRTITKSFANRRSVDMNV